jgi:hypothetical protein
MAFTHTHARTFSRSGETISASATATAASEICVDEAINNGVTDGQITLNLDQSELAGVFIISDQVVTIETNSGSAADDTFTLAANEAISWVDGDTAACPITADVTALFITNASGSTANVKMRFLQDPTP